MNPLGGIPRQGIRTTSELRQSKMTHNSEENTEALNRQVQYVFTKESALKMDHDSHHNKYATMRDIEIEEKDVEKLLHIINVINTQHLKPGHQTVFSRTDTCTRLYLPSNHRSGLVNLIRTIRMLTYLKKSFKKGNFHLPTTGQFPYHVSVASLNNTMSVIRYHLEEYKKILAHLQHGFKPGHSYTINCLSPPMISWECTTRNYRKTQLT